MVKVSYIYNIYNVTHIHIFGIGNYKYQGDKRVSNMHTRTRIYLYVFNLLLYALYFLRTLI